MGNFDYSLCSMGKNGKLDLKYSSDWILRQLTETDEKSTLSKTPHYNSSLIRQKSELQNGCYKKTKLAKFSEKRTFVSPKKMNISYPLMHTWAYFGVRTVRFLENLTCFVFL